MADENQHITLYAGWDHTLFLLTVQAGTGGRITQEAGGGYAAGVTVTLKAQADPGYTFDGWTTSNGGPAGLRRAAGLSEGWL